MKPAEIHQGRPRLGLHLGVVLALKFALLALLWYLLVMPYRVEVDAPAMGERLAQTAAQSNTAHPSHDESRNGPIQGSMWGGAAKQAPAGDFPAYRNTRHPLSNEFGNGPSQGSMRGGIPSYRIKLRGAGI